MLKLAQLVNDPSRLSQISNRHIVALCNLSTRIDTFRSKSTQKGQYDVVSFRLDITDDPDAVLECAKAGLALMKNGGYFRMARYNSIPLLGVTPICVTH